MLACTQYILKLRPRGSRSWNSKWRAWEPWVWLDPGVEGIILCVGGCSSTVHWLWCNAGLSNALSLPGGTPLPGAQQSMAFSTCVNGILCGTRLEERPLKWLQLKTSPSLLLLQKVYFKPPSLQCSDLSAVLARSCFGTTEEVTTAGQRWEQASGTGAGCSSSVAKGKRIMGLRCDSSLYELKHCLSWLFS